MGSGDKSMRKGAGAGAMGGGLECLVRLPSPVGNGDLQDLQEGKVIRAEVCIVSLAVM